MPFAVQATDLAKSYRLYDRPVDRLFEALTRRPRHRLFPALGPLTFEIEAGESMGLVGQNGAGKSTLLKLLCDVTRPTAGTLETSGTIASILELGAGFHPEFSGRDNAALNAAILGLGPGEVRRKLPAIFEFSELGHFLDQPVRTYSSGMYMRLAFSVAVNVDPDILIIDEALAVGDGHFQKKCVDKIREFQQIGKTIVFCSHALYFISTLCKRTIWLDHGAMRKIGSTLDVVHEYENFLLAQEKKADEASEPAALEHIPPVRIRAIEVIDDRGVKRTRFRTGENIHLRITIDSDDPAQQVHVLAGIDRASDQMQCFAIGTNFDGMKPFRGRTAYEVTLTMKNVPLVRGDYSLALFVGDEHGLHAYDRKDLLTVFSIDGDRYEVGLIRVEHDWRVREARSADAVPDAGIVRA